MARGKKKMKKTGRTGVPKKVRLLSWLSQGQHPVTGAECETHCAWPRTKGGQPLDACAGCFQTKNSCQTGGMGGRRKFVKGKQSAVQGKAVRVMRKSDVSGKDWLTRIPAQ